VNNCIWTKEGGTHVNSAISQISEQILHLFNKRLKTPTELIKKKEQLYAEYMIFVSVYVEKPIFASVCQDKLVTPVSQLEPLYKLSKQALVFLDKN
jgi:DNA gyrase/topoisomerase IV subunit B